MKYSFRYITALCLFAGLLGCAQVKVYYPGKVSFGAPTSNEQLNRQAYREKVKQLERELKALGPAVDPTEAHHVAETAIRESAVLAEAYQLVQPAVAHNLLVVMGFKDRGLCYQWTEDLMARLAALALKSFQLHWGVAFRGSDLREHNCVVITATGQSFNTGLVLDPWRHSGNLYWAIVKEDRYPWKVLPPNQW